MKKSLSYLGVAALLGLTSAVASAAPLSFTANGGYGTSAAFNVISSNVDATSTYTSPTAVSSFDSLIGQNIAVTDVSTNGFVNGYLAGTNPLGDAVDGSFLSSYKLLFSYTLSGTAFVSDGLGVFTDGTMDSDNNGLIDSAAILSGTSIVGGLDAIIPNYTTGTITITYQDLTGTILGVNGIQKILELNLVSATPDGTNVVLLADADYDWYTGTLGAVRNNLVEDFFSFVAPINGVTSWYDVWNSGTPVDPVQILTRSDFNIDPNFVPTSNCGAGVDCTTFERTNNLNVTTVVEVPEPGSIALLGLGLAGLGLMQRRRKAAK